MLILVAVIVVDILLLAGTIWSATHKPSRRPKFVIAREADHTPHALWDLQRLLIAVRSSRGYIGLIGARNKRDRDEDRSSRCSLLSDRRTASCRAAPRRRRSRVLCWRRLA
jgi:hypothetical protein